MRVSFPVPRFKKMSALMSTGYFGPSLCENTAEQFKTCGLKQYESIVDFHDRQPLFGRSPSNSNGWAHS